MREHPYDLPEIVVLEPQDVLPAYAAWVQQETQTEPLERI
jgi:uncharacterized protein involved in tolerance to divalent cations